MRINLPLRTKPRSYLKPLENTQNLLKLPQISRNQLKRTMKQLKPTKTCHITVFFTIAKLFYIRVFLKAPTRPNVFFVKFSDKIECSPRLRCLFFFYSKILLFICFGQNWFQNLI